MSTQKINKALQIQYKVFAPRNGRFKIQGVNVFEPRDPAFPLDPIDSNEPSILNEHLYPLVRLVTKKQWILERLWDREVQDPKRRQNLSSEELETLKWYILDYEKVLDAILNDESDEEPLKRWAWLESHTPHIQKLTTKANSKEDDRSGLGTQTDLANLDVGKLIRNDTWDIGKVLNYIILLHAPEETISGVLQKALQWLKSHEENRKFIEESKKLSRETTPPAPEPEPEPEPESSTPGMLRGIFKTPPSPRLAVKREPEIDDTIHWGERSNEEISRQSKKRQSDAEMENAQGEGRRRSQRQRNNRQRPADS